MFNRLLAGPNIAQQISDLLNSNNKLNSPQSKAKVLQDSKSYIVETVGHKVIGCIQISRQGYTISEIKHLCVDKSFRKTGIAKTLIHAAVNMSNTPAVYATIRRDNVASQKAFLSCGFIEANTYTTGSRDVVLFIKTCPKWQRGVDKTKEI